MLSEMSSPEKQPILLMLLLLWATSGSAGPRAFHITAADADVDPSSETADTLPYSDALLASLTARDRQLYNYTLKI